MREISGYSCPNSNNYVDYDDTEMSTLCDENVNDIHVHCIANPFKHKHTNCITVEQV